MPDRRPSRREFLRYSSGVGAAVMFAGCSSDDDPEASLEVDDQSGTGETLTVDKAEANVEYYIDVHYNDETARTEAFEADSTQEDVQVELDPPLEEEATVEVAVHDEAEDEEIVGEEIEYTVEDSE